MEIVASLRIASHGTVATVKSNQITPSILVLEPRWTLTRSHSFYSLAHSFPFLTMAQLAPNPPIQPLRISQLLPTVKCSSCTQPVPLDQLGDHICPSTSPPSNLASGTIPAPPPLKVQTAPRPSSNAPPRSPMDMFFPRRRPSANPPQDIPVRDGNGARLRGSASPALSRGAPGSAPAPVPPRNGVRSPAPSLHSTPAARPVLPPPSRMQSPFVPSSSSSLARRPTSRPEMGPNGVVPRMGTRSPGPAPSHLDTHPRRPSVAQSPPHASSPIHRRPSAPQSPPPVTSPIQRRPSAPQSPPHMPSSIQRRPSAPQSPPHAPSPILRRPSVPQPLFVQNSNYGTAGDPRSAPMPQPNHHPVRATPSRSPSNYSLHSFVSPEFDTQSGGAAGMAGVGRRGFAAVARAAMFASPPTSRLHQPTAELPAPWVPASSPPQSTDNYRIKSPPLPILEPPSGMSSFIHFTYIRRCDIRGPWRSGSASLIMFN
jgi:hypothetical protein